MAKKVLVYSIMAVVVAFIAGFAAGVGGSWWYGSGYGFVIGVCLNRAYMNAKYLAAEFA